jgi:gliding motility-associated-like protein
MTSTRKYFFVFGLVILSFTKVFSQAAVVVVDQIKHECTGSFNGSLRITVTSGTEPLSYFMFGLNFGDIKNGFLDVGVPVTISGLRADNYLISVSDGDPAPNFSTFVTINNVAPGITATVDPGYPQNNSSCAGPNGAINITVSGGTSAYDFAWTGTSGFTGTTEDISGLNAQTYQVSITDQNANCSASISSLVITDPSPTIETVSPAGTQDFCTGNDATISLLTTEGFPVVYEILLNGNPTGVTANGTGGPITLTLPNGSFVDGDVLTVKSTNQLCTPAIMNGSVTINVVTLSLSNVVTDNTRCVMPFNGAIDLTVSGGVGPFTYLWSGPGGFTANTQDITALQNGSYSVTATDVPSGCNVSANINVGNVVPTISLSSVVTDNSRCVLPFNGAINLTVSGAVGPFTYAWTGPGGFTGNTEDISALVDGAYSVTVTQTASGCTATSNIAVSNTAPTLSVSSVITSNSRCVLPFNGAINLTVSGASAPFTFAWAGPSGFTASTEDISTLVDGNYSVTVTHTASGCSTIGNFTVGNTAPTLLLSSVVTNNTRCLIPFNGAINLTVAGTAGPFTYAWTGPSGFTASTEDINALAVGTYNITVTDNTSGCTSSTSIAVNNNAPTISLSSVVTNNTRCFSPFNGAIDLTVAGSAGPFTYAWSGPSGFTANTEDITTLIAGSYTITVTDTPTGCTATTNINVADTPPTLSITPIITDNTKCIVPFNGAIDLTMGGSAGPFTYAWTGPGGFTANTQDITALQPGSYSVSITDTPSGCIVLGSFTVGNNPVVLVLTNAVTDNTKCIFPFDGAIDLTVAGSAGPFTFAWTGPGGFTANTEDISALQSGSYSITVTDNTSGCTASGNINVGSTATVLTLSNAVSNNTRCVAPLNGAIDLTVAGSAGPFTFAWTGPGGFTAATEDISVLQSGSYSVTVTETATGCNASALNISVGNTTPTLTTSRTVVSNTNCVIPFNGSINLSVSGTATGPFTYAWTGPGGFTANTQDISNLQNGIYMVLVTDNPSGCTGNRNVTVPLNIPALTITPVVTNNTRCVATFNGAIDITISGAAGPFTYAWTGPNGFTASTEDIASLETGTYNVTVTRTATGCTASGSFNVGNSPVVLSLSNTVTDNASCVSPFTGAIDLTVTGSAGPFTFAWTGPGGFTANTEDITALQNGSYSVTVTDVTSACTASTANIAVGNVNPTLSITNTTTNNTSCIIPFTGAIDITVNGTAGPFTFAWTGPSGFTSATEDISALNGGSYDVLVTDVNTGCTANASIPVNNASGVVTITTDAITDNTRCIVPFNGAISITISGSAGPFTYAWTGPNGFTAATEDISGLEPGAYSVNVTDNVSGCSSTGNFTINNTVPAVGGTTSITDNSSCIVPFNGAIDLTVTGTATGPFTFAWSGPGGFTAATEDVSALQDGVYGVTITDNLSGCSSLVNATVGNTAPTLSITNTSTNNTKCVSPFTGTIDITVAGSAGPFTFAWTGPSAFTGSTEDISALQDGTYDVTVTDSNTGCTATASINVGITLPSVTVTAAAITDNSKCAAPFNGAIILKVVPASGTYSYAWTGPGGFTSNSKNLTSLAPGSYQVVVTDIPSGCTTTQNFTVNDNAPAVTITLDTNIDNTSCTAPFDGALLITASGGSGLFSYSWVGPNGFTASTEDIANIENGSYDITVTDLNLGCTATATYAVADNTPIISLTSQVIVDNTKCKAPFDGSISITAGGTPGPYTFNWTGPNGYTNTGSAIANLQSGVYNVTVTDQTTGCNDTFPLTVNDNTPPVTIAVDAITPNSNCIAPFNGSISITAGGTAGPFTFAWTGPNSFSASIEDLTLLEDGDYTVTVTDAVLGCTASQTITVGDSRPVITVALQSVTGNTKCMSPFDGTASVSASGTAGPYDFSWTGPNGFLGAGASIANLESGDFIVTATDQLLGCSGNLTVTVPDNRPVITINTAVAHNTVCVSPFNGAIDITAVSGTPGPFSFSWTGPNGFVSANQNVSALEPGSYDVTVTDTNLGCQGNFTINVNDNAPIISAIPFAITPNTNCNSPYNGSLGITVTGTPGPYSYAWTGPNGFTDNIEDITGLQGGNYDVTIIDTNLGCTGTFSFNVPDNSTPATITLNSLVANTACSSPFNGSITITAGGTAGPFTISWTGPGGFTSSSATISSLQSGNYTVTITDTSLGCMATNMFIVPNNAIGCGGLNCFAFTVVTDTQTQRPSCNNQNDGVVTLDITGSTSGNYIISILEAGTAVSPPQIGPSGTYAFAGLSPGNYQYRIEDQAGNICIQDFQLLVKVTVDATASTFVDATCFGTSTGRAQITINSGGSSPYEYSVDGGANWIPNLVSGDVVSNLPPNGTYNILIRDDASDACPAEVQVIINNANPRLKATFTVTPASCNGSDGAINNLVGSGGVPAAVYTFLVDGNIGPFDQLTGGTHTLTISDGTCSRDSLVVITFPGMISHIITVNDADCSNNGNSGTLELIITDIGLFQVALSTDQFNAPDDASFNNYPGPILYSNLANGTYFIYMRSSSNQDCITRSDPQTIQGAFAIKFDIIPICVDNKVSIKLDNITADFASDAGLHLNVLDKLSNPIVNDLDLGWPPVDNYVLNYDDPQFAFLKNEGEYQIFLTQIQTSSVFCSMQSDIITYRVYPQLSAQVGIITESYPDIPTGTLQVHNFDGGAIPYDIMIELDSASVIGQTYQTDWQEVVKNNNLQYETDFSEIPAGRYTVTIADSVGCSIELTARVPLDTDIYIPNVFTPNGDDKNEEFYIRNLPAGSNVKLVITNRWGNEVFTSKNYQNNWNGEGASEGIYFYSLQIGSQKPITGWVEIMKGSKP